MKVSLSFLAGVLFYTAAAGTQPLIYTDADFAADVIHAAALRQAGITSLKGDAVLTYNSGESVNTFRVGFARVPPDKARLEIMGLFGEVLFVLTADGDRMMVQSKADRKAVVCKATRENLTALLGMDLGGDIHLVLDWIEGRAPLYAETVATGEVLATAEENDDGSATVRWVPRNGDVPLQMLTFDPGDGRVLFSRVYDPDGAAETDIYYDDFRDRDGFTVPYDVTINRLDSTVEVNFNRITMNAEIKDRAFSTGPPRGAEVFYWDDLSEANDGDR